MYHRNCNIFNILRVFIFVAVFLGCTSTGRVGLCFLWFYVQELPKAQPAVVLVLKSLRRRGNGLKSHPTDWEKPGIEPATPGLQDIGLSPTPRRLYGYLLYGLLCPPIQICSENPDKLTCILILLRMKRQQTKKVNCF